MHQQNLMFNAKAYEVILNLINKLRKVDLEGTKVWEQNIDKDLERLFAIWKIYQAVPNLDGYTGLVLECKSRLYGDTVVKIYPPFLSRRYVKESYILSTLKNYPQAPLLALDENSHAMLLGRVTPGDYIVYEEDQVDIATMFRQMLKNRILASDLNNKPKEIKGIVEQTEDEFIIASQYDYYPKLMKYLLDCSKSVYIKYFNNDEKFLLHGDVYYKNALRSKEGIRIIDPVGYVDAFVFEYMPLLTYELVMHVKPEEYLDKYKEITYFFSTFTDISKFNAASFIFLVKQIVPSIYEANDEYKRANLYMKIIKELFLNDNNEFSLNKYAL